MEKEVSLFRVTLRFLAASVIAYFIYLSDGVRYNPVVNNYNTHKSELTRNIDSSKTVLITQAVKTKEAEFDKGYYDSIYRKEIQYYFRSKIAGESQIYQPCDTLVQTFEKVRKADSTVLYSVKQELHTAKGIIHLQDSLVELNNKEISEMERRIGKLEKRKRFWRNVGIGSAAVAGSVIITQVVK